MATDTVIDPELMSLDDLRKAAEAEAEKVSTNKTPEQIAEEQKAVDDKAAADKIEADKVAEAQKVKVFHSERTVDLGDGAGVQVFKGKGDSREAALEDLSDKLVEAQRHATKKIRDLSTQVKKPDAKTFTPEEESLYSAELLKTPTEAFKKLFHQVTGVDIEDFKSTHQKEKAFQAGQEKKRTADTFVTAHPEFADTPRNGKLINKWCELHNDFSLEGLNKAYQDLNESGLLDVKDAEAGEEQKKAEAERQRIADEAANTSSLRTRRASGLSTQRRAALPTPAAPTEDDMYNMPLEELRKKSNQQLAARS